MQSMESMKHEFVGICGFQHLARHPGLQSIPLDAHRKVSMVCPSLIINYGARAELCQTPFENLMNQGILWIPKRICSSSGKDAPTPAYVTCPPTPAYVTCPHPSVCDMPPPRRISSYIIIVYDDHI